MTTTKNAVLIGLGYNLEIVNFKIVNLKTHSPLPPVKIYNVIHPLESSQIFAKSTALHMK